MDTPKNGCPLCGSIGLHACPGKPIIWTEEDKKRLDAALRRIYETNTVMTKTEEK